MYLSHLNLQELDDEVDVLMTQDNVNVCVHTGPIRFRRLTSGWVFAKPQTTQIGVYTADVYAVDNLAVESMKRREHLTDEDMRRNKAIVTNLQSGQMTEQEMLVCWSIYLLNAAGQPTIVESPRDKSPCQSTTAATAVDDLRRILSVAAAAAIGPTAAGEEVA